MRFEGIKGNDSVKEALGRMIDSGRVPHAMMFHENDGGGGVAFCLAFLKELMGGSPKVEKMIHPDVHFLYPAGGGLASELIFQFRALVASNPYFTEMDFFSALGLEKKKAIISVAEASALLDKLSFSALEGGWKAVVLYLPENLGVETANKLLKSIEEPSGNTIFLLVTHDPSRVMPTIYSRCQNIRLCPVEGGAVREESELEQLCRQYFGDLMNAAMARDLEAALGVGEQIAALPSREQQKSFCKVASALTRKVFAVQQGMERTAGLTPSDEGMVRLLASGTRNSFPRKALSAFDRASMFIERQVNAKIVFCDMASRLYLYI